jgi:hypothetical protein
MKLIIAGLTLFFLIRACGEQRAKESYYNQMRIQQNSQEYKRQVDRTICRQTHPAYRNGCRM